MSQKHPLHRTWKWTFSTANACQSESFLVSDVEGFWSRWNVCPAPSQFVVGTMFSFLEYKQNTKEGEEENQENVSFIRYTCSIPAEEKKETRRFELEKIDFQWSELLMALIGEQFCFQNTCILGARLKTKRKGLYIETNMDLFVQFCSKDMKKEKKEELLRDIAQDFQSKIQCFQSQSVTCVC